MFTRASLIASATRLIKDVSLILKPADFDDCVNSAVDIHSRYRKKISVVALTATGGRLYDLPSGWEYGFSEAGFQIEYPVDDTAGWPTMLPATMAFIYDAPGKQQIRFRETMLSNRLPASPDLFRVHFQIRYQITDVTAAQALANSALSLTTVPDSDYWPMVYLVTSQACLMMASALAQNVDSSMSADGANYRDKDSKFIALAKEWFAKYKSAIIPEKEDLKAVGIIGEFEQDDFNRTQYPFYWRDESDHLNSDR